MPVVALPPSNTPRYWVDYVANGTEHTFQFRYPGGALSGEPDTSFLNGITLWLSEMLAFLPADFAITGARYAPAGSDVTLPATEPASPGTGAGTAQAAERPAFITFVGRSAAGRKVKVQLLSIAVSPVGEVGVYSDYRITPGQSADFDAAVAALQLLSCVAIDGNPITWYTYGNLGYSAYWQKRQRGGT